MRDRLQLPIAYNAARLGFYYEQPVVSFPTMEVSAGEVMALCVAQKALALYQGAGFYQQLTAALRRVTASLQEKISFTWSDLDRAVSFQKVGRTDSDLQDFETVSEAVLKSQELHFEYRKLGGTGFEKRRLRPYHLGSIENQWYAIGFDLQREQIRTFALTRMRAVKSTTIHFQRPANFSIEREFRDSFGVFAGGQKRYAVCIRFEPIAGQLVAERTWHESQKILTVPGGEVELTLHLSSLREVERWILSWGPRARVLAPAELAERVRRSAAETASLYAPPG